MKEFIEDIEEIEDEATRDQRILDLIEEYKAKDEPITRAQAEAEIDRGKPVVFKLGERTMRAYPPNEGQLIFMMASLGRGQTQDQRFASIINIMINCLDENDGDWLEARLLDGDPRTRLKAKKVEEIFEFLSEEWFGRPTQQPSDSA